MDGQDDGANPLDDEEHRVREPAHERAADEAGG
jgi:hypothetical protein